MPTEANTAIVQRYWEAWSTGNLTLLDDIVAADYRHHSFTTGEVVHGIENTAKRNIPQWRAAFPDLLVRLEDVVAAGDIVTVRWRGQGTHQGDFTLVQTIPPTGRQATWVGIDLYRLADGKIVESWRVWDRLGLLQQLGVVPMSA